MTMVWIFVLFGLFSAGVLLGTMSQPEPVQPWCPTEDSCQPQYQDGTWTIVEVTP